MSPGSVTRIDLQKDSQDPMDFSKRVSHLRSSFGSGKTLDVDFRLKQLKALLRLYTENNDQILGALKKDMRKSEMEGYLYEVHMMKTDCMNAIRFLKSWAKTKVLHRNWLVLADKAFIEKVPYGVVLVIGTWNYPFNLSLVPMCGAIAAGNCVIVKPSEISAHTAAVIAELIPKYLDPECYQVVLGGAAETQKLLEERFDYIFYTGSYNIGKKVHAAANKYLTPVTLELGGKSPVYIDESVDYAMAAKRITWGKCMNMGQTCVAPDYILCSKKVEIELIKEIKKTMTAWYGTDWKKASDLSRIGHQRHFERLRTFLANGTVAMGGTVDESELWIEPTVLVDVQPTDPIMLEEVFGPILPILTVNCAEDAIRFIRARPSPLCLYIFSEDVSVQKRMRTVIQSGTAVINDTIIQFAIDELPFGGIGDSGLGSYHGKFSFKTFTHHKGVVVRDFSLFGDKVGAFRYPPYSQLKIKLLGFIICHWKKFKIDYFDYFPHLICFLLGIALVYLIQYFQPIIWNRRK